MHFCYLALLKIIITKYPSLLSWAYVDRDFLNKCDTLLITSDKLHFK